MAASNTDWEAYLRGVRERLVECVERRRREAPGKASAARVIAGLVNEIASLRAGGAAWRDIRDALVEIEAITEVTVTTVRDRYFEALKNAGRPPETARTRPRPDGNTGPAAAPMPHAGRPSPTEDGPVAARPRSLLSDVPRRTEIVFGVGGAEANPNAMAGFSALMSAPGQTPQKRGDDGNV